MTMKRYPRDLYCDYRKLWVNGCIALPSIYVFAIAIIVWLAAMGGLGFKGEEWQAISLFMTIAVAVSIVPLIMILQGATRKIRISQSHVEYTNCFGSRRIAFSDVEEATWRPSSSGGGVRISSAGESIKIPFYGLRQDDAKRLIARLRNLTAQDKQEGWHAFLYYVCYGRFGDSATRTSIGKEIGAPAQAAVGLVIVPILYFLRGLRRSGAVPVGVLLVFLAVVAAMAYGIAIWTLTQRSKRIAMLAEKHVQQHGDAIPF